MELKSGAVLAMCQISNVITTLNNKTWNFKKKYWNLQELKIAYW